MNLRRPALLGLLLAPTILSLLLGPPHSAFRAEPIPQSALRTPHSAFRLHPAPSVIHDFIVTLNKDSAELWARFEVSPPLVPQVFRILDTNDDGLVQPQEQQTWVTAYMRGLQATVDDQPQQLMVARV